MCKNGYDHISWACNYYNIILAGSKFDDFTKSPLKFGCIYSLDWTTGLDYWTGLLDSPLTPKILQIWL